MRVLIISLTDDPLDPPGGDRYGGAQLFMFDLCRHLVRKGNYVVFITRKSRADKPKFQQLGPFFWIHRLRVGPECELSHHDLWEWQQELSYQTAVKIKNLEPFDSVLSYNWISGLLALEVQIHPHIHHILSLGRVRRELGEEEHASDLSRDYGEVKVFQEAARLVCVCKDELYTLKRLYPEVDSSKAVVIPYPVDPDAYNKRPQDSSVFLRWKAKRLEKGF